MVAKLRLPAVLVMAALVLTACGDDDDDDDNGGQAGVEQQFGDKFADAFNADPNDEPIDPMPGDIIPISFTDDPVDF